MNKLKYLILLLALTACSQTDYKNEISKSQVFMRLLKNQNYDEAKKLMVESSRTDEGVNDKLLSAAKYLADYGIPTPDKAQIKKDTLYDLELTIISYQLANDTIDKPTLLVTIEENKYAGQILSCSIVHGPYK